MADEETLRRDAQLAICAAFAVPPHEVGLKPHPARLRFRLIRCVDHVANWLADHDHSRAAIRLWRTFGLW